MRRGVVLGCFVLGAASAGAITMAMPAAPEDDPPRPAVVAAGAAADAHVVVDTGAQEFQKWSDAILARPLFAVERRPFATAAAAAAPVVLPRLSGIMIAPSGSRAILAPAGGGKADVVTEGSNVGGYLVQSIETGEVVLIGPDGRHILHLSFDPAAPAAASQASP